MFQVLIPSQNDYPLKLNVLCILLHVYAFCSTNRHI